MDLDKIINEIRRQDRAKELLESLKPYLESIEHGANNTSFSIDNPEECSEFIVNALKSLEDGLKDAIKESIVDNGPIVDSVNELSDSISKTTEKIMSELDGKDKRESRDIIKQARHDDLMESISKIIKSVEEIDIPENIDYSSYFNKLNDSLSSIKDYSDAINNICVAIEQLGLTKSIPDYLIDKNRVKVVLPESQVNRFSGGASSEFVKDSSGNRINPATEATQSEISAKLDPATDIETQDLITVGTTAVEITFANTKGIVILYSADTNSGNIFIGKSDVGNNGNKMFAMLTPGQARAFPYDDSVNALYARSNTSNQKLSASLYLGAGPITFDGFDGRTIGLLSNLISIGSGIYSINSQFVKSDYVYERNVLTPGGIDFPWDNKSSGHYKVRKSSNERTDQINGGGDWYGCSGIDLDSSGGVVFVDISRQNLNQDFRALESVKFIIRNNINTPETGVVKITVMGWDAQIGTYVPKAFTYLDIRETKLTDKDTYICGMTPTVIQWNRDESRYGYILFEDIGGTLSSSVTTIEVLLEDYSFNGT